ncbi:UNVERIFIED_CONTAM: hypothetical protein K2H54_055720 [Gekko kuhli]
MAQFPTPYGGNLDIWAITVDERAKHDQQFHSLKPVSGFITEKEKQTAVCCCLPPQEDKQYRWTACKFSQ